MSDVTLWVADEPECGHAGCFEDNEVGMREYGHKATFAELVAALRDHEGVEEVELGREIPRTQLIEELVSLLRVPDALVGKVAKLPDGWEYGNDVDRALLPVAESNWWTC